MWVFAWRVEHALDVAIERPQHAAAQPHFSPWPRSLPVFRLRKCNLVQAGQVIESYRFSDASSSSSSQCWTFIDVAGQVKTNRAIVNAWRLCDARP
jgi:hypothetical protein